jgi:hypothetical protein
VTISAETAFFLCRLTAHISFAAFVLATASRGLKLFSGNTWQLYFAVCAAHFVHYSTVLFAIVITRGRTVPSPGIFAGAVVFGMVIFDCMLYLAMRAAGKLPRFLAIRSELSRGLDIAATVLIAAIFSIAYASSLLRAHAHAIPLGAILVGLAFYASGMRRRPATLRAAAAG